MKLHERKNAIGEVHGMQRIDCGEGCGHGQTSGRGGKGQTEPRSVKSKFLSASAARCLLVSFMAILCGFVVVGRCEAADEISLSLADDGVARLPIIVSPNASANTKNLANELAAYLQKISGAAFVVQTGPGTNGIVLGTLQEFPNPALAKVLEVRNVYDGREAYVIRSEPKRLLLLGATEQGASHAAFRLLELVGCRRFFPAKEWEVIPSIPALKIAVHEADRPAMLSRSIWYGGAYFHDVNGVDRRSYSDYLAWCRHNRMNSYGEGNVGSLQIANGHAWQSIIAEDSETFKKHPEYLALVGGKRQGVQLCVSNPEVRKIAAQWVLDRFEKKPEVDMVSLEPSDGARHCEC